MQSHKKKTKKKKPNSVSVLMNYENFVFTLHFFALLSKCYKSLYVCVCYYADHECSSRQVQLSRLDTVNVGRSPGC